MPQTKGGKGTDTTAVVQATVAAPVKLAAPPTATTAPMPGASYSLHDCAQPGQAAVHNMVWPLNLAGTDGLTFKIGCVVVCRDPNAVVSVTW